MRPVNLIPPELRRGDSAPLRTGPLAYILVGALALALAGVTMLVLASNEVSEKKEEVATLQREDAAAKARAERLAPYAQFKVMSEQRVETIASLADSRFDWPRVMRELALVLPSDVLLSDLSAGAAAAHAGEAEAGGEGLGGIQGPSLEMNGCTTSQDAVARFITALKDIDGVTRVGLESSSAGGDGESAEAGGSNACEASGFETQFSLVVAFDAAPAPA
ncbi:MAG TPA: PilN domain-containing protein, partial [Solirubrobacterales bacterium]|nr:PilN domain-containing protein [Solirubrobacterales bacterium]